MRTALIRDVVALALACAGLALDPAIVAAQEGHEEHSAAEHAAGEQEEHAEHAAHEKNEIAVFLGATRRLKFEEDETGFTTGLEYIRQIRPRVGLSIAAEWSDGTIERDWIAMLKLGINPFEGWAHPFYFFVGAGVEVARIDEVLLEEDAHGGEETGEVHEPAETLSQEHAAEGEHVETEVDALMRLGAGWAFHVGSFSIIPNLNFDIVGEDWAGVGGITLGYRF